MEESESGVVGIEAFEDSDEGLDFLGKECSNRSETATTSVSFLDRHARKIILILVVALAAAVSIIIAQQGRGGMELPANHPDISQMRAGEGNVGSKAPDMDQDAVTKLEARLAQNPQDTQAIRDLGKLYFDAGYYHDAAEYFERATKIDNSDIEVSLMLGVCRYSIGDYSGAQEAWLQATQIDPQVAQPWYNLGFVYLMQDPPDYEQTRQVWNKAIQLAPESELAKEILEQLQQLNQTGDTAANSSQTGGTAPNSSKKPAHPAKPSIKR